MTGKIAGPVLPADGHAARGDRHHLHLMSGLRASQETTRYSSQIGGHFGNPGTNNDRVKSGGRYIRANELRDQTRIEFAIKSLACSPSLAG